MEGHSDASHCAALASFQLHLLPTPQPPLPALADGPTERRWQETQDCKEERNSHSRRQSQSVSHSDLSQELQGLDIREC